MGRFITFIDIKVVHGYYGGMSGCFRFRPTAKTERLMRSREVPVRYTSSGCQFLIEDGCAGFLSGDELELTLQMQDNDFALVTQLDDYRPQTFYRLDLPEDSREIDVVSALVPTEGQKEISHFCYITIKLADKMLEKAKAGMPQEYLLRFREAAYRWEFLLVPRRESMDESKTFLLEDIQGKFFFTLPEKYMNPSFGGMMWRIFSTSPIVCRKYQDCDLQLSEVLTKEFSKLLSDAFSRDIQPEEFFSLPPESLPGVLPKILVDRSLKKRIVSRFISCPQPGKFQTNQRDCIREICYI